MWLIDVETLRLHEYYGSNVPDYAILSHTWGDEEVTFRDWKKSGTDNLSGKSGFAKIQGACTQASLHRLKWLWVDTSCIDKRSSAELSEAINSMFRYYEESQVCFAYLSDVPTALDVDRSTIHSQVAHSRWFTRGWTLQELIAPRRLIFFAADWTRIGEKNDETDFEEPLEFPLSATIVNMTGI